MYPPNRRLGKPLNWSGHFGEGTISCLCLELDRDHPACSIVSIPTTRKWEKPSTMLLWTCCLVSHINPVLTSHCISSRLILILSSHLPLGIASGLFPYGFPPNPNTLYRSLLSLRTCQMPHQSCLPWFECPNNTLSRAQIMKLHIMQCSPVSYFFLPLRPKYLPRHPVLRHTQSLFFNSC